MAAALPVFPTAELDPNGPIARQARGEPINPLEWSGELALHEARTALAAAPEAVRNAQVTVSLPGVGDRTVSTEILVAMAMDPSNLLGIGPVEGTTASTLEGDLAADSASPRAGLLTWEHQGSYHLSKTEMSGSTTSPAPANSMEFESLS